MVKIVDRIQKILTYTKSGFGIRSKFASFLMGLAAPLSHGVKPSLLGCVVPKVLQIGPNRLRGMRLLIDPHDWSQTVIYDEILLSNGYDLNVLQFKPEHIVDCGGHIGMFSLVASTKFPSSRLTVFEPNPENFARLKENCKLNRLSWDCRLGAVGENAGESFLEVVNTHSARLSPHSGVPTKIYDLTQFISSLNASSLLLKVDIEGEELKIWPKLIPALPTMSVVFFETHHGSEGWSFAEQTFQDFGFIVHKTVDRGKFCDGYAERMERKM